MSYRLGILVSHPIQYYAPWFRHLAERLDLDVFYAHRQDAAGQAQAGFGVAFDWDVPLLEGYRYHWLRNVAARPGIGTFRGCDTPELYDIIDRRRFDAFLVFGWNRKSSWQAIRACWKNRVPVLMRGDSQLETSRSLAKRALKSLPYRWLLPRIDAHLYVGQRNREYLEHYGVPAERLFFCPHFVDNDFFATSAKRARVDGTCARIRQDLGIPQDAFVFLFVGKLIAKKRPADFVNACRTAFQAPDTSRPHAIIVGDGPLRSELQEIAAPAADRIHFAGFLNQSELPAYYAASNALVLPSEASETWGLVVNEAMACGIPCIVSDAVGCGPDLIETSRTGDTYPAGDVPALAACLRSQSEPPADDRGPSASELARKMTAYSIDAAAEGLLTALKSLTSTRNGSVRSVAEHHAANVPADRMAVAHTQCREPEHSP